MDKESKHTKPAGSPRLPIAEAVAQLLTHTPFRLGQRDLERHRRSSTGERRLRRQSDYFTTPNMQARRDRNRARNKVARASRKRNRRS